MGPFEILLSQARRKVAGRPQLQEAAYCNERRLGGGTVSGLDGIANYGISDEAERTNERLEAQ